MSHDIDLYEKKIFFYAKMIDKLDAASCDKFAYDHN